VPRIQNIFYWSLYRIRKECLVVSHILPRYWHTCGYYIFKPDNNSCTPLYFVSATLSREKCLPSRRVRIGRMSLTTMLVMCRCYYIAVFPPSTTPSQCSMPTSYHPNVVPPPSSTQFVHSPSSQSPNPAQCPSYKLHLSTIHSRTLLLTKPRKLSWYQFFPRLT
jgi:hypothetical protein